MVEGILKGRWRLFQEANGMWLRLRLEDLVVMPNLSASIFGDKKKKQADEGRKGGI